MKYWYKDNWDGSIKEFDTLKSAKKWAAMEDGVSITIFSLDKKGKTKIEAIITANGYTYP